MSPGLIAATQKLVRTIRKQLPLVGEPNHLASITLQIRREDLFCGQADCPRPFATLLSPLSAEGTPDRFLRLTEQLQAVEAALREVEQLLAIENDADAQYLQLIVKELREIPLYWWRWTGKSRQFLGFDMTGAWPTMVFSPWYPVLTGFFPIDPTLLDSLLSAVQPVTSETIEWSYAESPEYWAEKFGFSTDTFLRRCKEGKIKAKQLSTKSYQIAISDLPKINKPEKFRPRPTDPK
jgi:hypothetical protein